ncbi:MAG: hypothetical protein AVDCRST_MAG66-221 [uncultured Pseudonocardia sp.]|uniref:Lipoprotein n=1 Tax=uncultured Pseudonocardia sp. TaxID=211455 RepID=A0A6J4N7U6_9PSEU|nr:MAG: hypothetical protein AVDCRST_MAG66-221 [uncultured Pseudonocardia sp.]
MIARWTTALLALLLLAAGCSAGAADAAPLTRYYDVRQLIDAVAAQERADGTARFSLRGELVGTGDSRLRFTGVGALRFGEQDVELSFTQVVTQRGAEPQETGFVVPADAVYLRLPDAPAARPWVRVDPADTAPEAQRRIALARSVTERADPTSALVDYADATLVTDAADDVIEGDPAIRYTIVTDLARAADITPDADLRAQLEQQVRGGLTRVTSTLWVDAAHRPLRSEASQELPGIGTLTVTSTFRDWGATAPIEPPPADQVR